MTNDGFTKTQLGQLKELLDDRLGAQETRLATELDRRFIEERAYYRQLIKDELADIRTKLDQVTLREDNDAKAAL